MAQRSDTVSAKALKEWGEMYLEHSRKSPPHSRRQRMRATNRRAAGVVLYWLGNFFGALCRWCYRGALYFLKRAAAWQGEVTTGEPGS